MARLSANPASSMKGTPMTEALWRYVVERFAKEEAELLARMRKRADAAGLPPIMISEEQAKFLSVFLKAMGARRVLDVGTLFGYSAAVMARALPADGRVVTLEVDPRAAEVARKNLAELELLGKVEILEGPALEAMHRLDSGTFDFVLVDADKPNYLRYLEESVRLLRDGGVVAADNAFAFGLLADANLSKGNLDYPNVEAIRTFNDALARHPKLTTIVVPLGDGMTLSWLRK